MSTQRIIKQLEGVLHGSKPSSDPFSTLLSRITLLKGDKGDRGPMGPQGLKGTSGKDGLDGQDGKDGRNGRDGADGRNGKDGKDAVANPEQIVEIAAHAVDGHEKRYQHELLHDAKMLGTLTLDGVADGQLFMRKGDRIVGVEMPKAAERQAPMRSGGGTSDRLRGRTVTADSTVDPHDQIIHIDASAGNITLTFYSAVGNDWRHHYLKRIDATENTVTLVLQGSETIEFQTDDQLPFRGSGREVYSDGSNWFVKHA